MVTTLVIGLEKQWSVGKGINGPLVKNFKTSKEVIDVVSELRSVKSACNFQGVTRSISSCVPLERERLD